MTWINHDPRCCRDALESTKGPVVLDLETTGLFRHHQIVSAGLLVDDRVHILFVRSAHISIENLSPPVFREALRPLERPDLTVIGHNLPFDLGFLRREGIRTQGEARDTLKLLRLVDQDRGGADDMARAWPRRDLRAPAGSPATLDYRLKHVVPQILGIRMAQFPGNLVLAPYPVHTRYLTCDLLGTWLLHEHLWQQLGAPEQRYYRELVAPLIPVLLDLNERGVAADPDFICRECDRLEDVMARLSSLHQSQQGLALGMDARQMGDWLFGRLRLPVLKRALQGKRWLPSLDNSHLALLLKFTEDAVARKSLQLIQSYRQATSLLVRLRSLLRYVDPRTGRIHSNFNDRQATGRISSSAPNLQQLAKTREFEVLSGDGSVVKESICCRNALRATTGHELAVFDIAQADIRVLAHVVESFPRTAAAHRQILRQERDQRLGDRLAPFLAALQQCHNPSFVGQEEEGPPEFSPLMPADLAEDFRQADGDFYTKAATRILDRPPQDRKDANRFKSIILGIVNGKGPPSLAKDLDCTEDEARGYLQAFERAYPKVTAYKALMYDQIACTGQSSTFMGRVRTVTAHRWLVTEPKVEILVSYRGSDVYWLRIVPLEPGRRVLTSYVLKAWNAHTGRLIYDHQRGRLSPRPYRLFETNDLQYLLPVRNWGWRSIRRVRARGEEAAYEGFDATARSAFNFICQGGTADVSKLMMLASQPLCAEFGARLLIQIHDELVFEVPQERIGAFQASMRLVLEKESVPGFQVPILVEPKRGVSFGNLS